MYLKLATCCALEYFQHIKLQPCSRKQWYTTMYVYAGYFSYCTNRNTIAHMHICATVLLHNPLDWVYHVSIMYVRTFFLIFGTVPENYIVYYTSLHSQIYAHIIGLMSPLKFSLHTKSSMSKYTDAVIYVDPAVCICLQGQHQSFTKYSTPTPYNIYYHSLL